MNTLTIFSPRTGSTILNELLAFHYRNIDLDEFVSGAIRQGTLNGYVKNIPKPVRDDLKNILDSDSSFGLRKPRIDYVLSLKESWSAKCIGGSDNKLSGYFIEHALKQGTRIFYTCRRDLKSQCWSMIMAGLRHRHIDSGKITDRMAYVSVNTIPYPELHPSKIDVEFAKGNIRNIVSTAAEARKLYERFGGTMVVYEDTIQKGDFSICDITEKTVDSYNKLKTRLEKPPQIQPEQYVTNWKEIDELIESMVI